MRMAILGKITSWVLLLSVLLYSKLSLVSALCELSVLHQSYLYNFSLASPTNRYPHGVLSEDGFYKIARNDTFLWFQLCDRMIFNHDPPRCFECKDCGGSLHCGIKCSALVAVRTAGYYVCTTIGKSSGSDVSLIDKKNPQKGVVVKMSSSSTKVNCSLSVSIFCDLHGLQGPDSAEKIGDCDYTTVLRHPAGCAKVISVNGRGWGWFGIIITLFISFLGGYLLVGMIYRYFFLGIQGADVVPNLEFWLSLPKRSQNLSGALIRKVRGRPQVSQTSYSPVQDYFR